MKTIINCLIWAIIIFALLRWVGGLEITFKPLSIKMPNWANLIAFIFFVLGLIFYTYRQHEIGYKQGVNDTLEQAEKFIDKTKELVENEKSIKDGNK
jgi:uncharacterized membrane protein